MAAVTKNGRALEFASDVLKGDRKFVLARVKQDGLSLRHASNRGDKEIVVAAVTQDGEALSYAFNKLKGDKDVVLAAVTNYGTALR